MTIPTNVPVYTWSQLTSFRAHILALGGSGDVSSGAEVHSDVDICGRYARAYSAELPDIAERTLTFYAIPIRRGEYGTPEYVPCVALTGCPWGTQVERDDTYRELALSGCVPNDMRADALLMSLVDQSKAGQ